MQILITGTPTSGHRRVGAMLAYRLDLNYVSAYELADSFCKSYGISREEFDEHTDSKIDEQFNQCILARLADEKNYVCDCLGITQLPMTGLKIFLDREIFEETGDVSDVYKKIVTEKATSYSIFGTNIYKPNNYDMYLITNGKSTEYITQWIIDSIVNATYLNKGVYIPAYMCIPNTSELPVSTDAYYKKHTSYSVMKYMCAYILDGDFTQAVLNAEHDDLLYVPFDQYLPTMASPVDLQPVAFYEPWLEQTNDNTGVALLSLMMANYCHAMESYNYELAYTNFTVNGNPVKRLIELGFHN